MISMLCELSVLPHRRTATHATSLLHSVLQQVDPAARRSLQLQARDEGLLLHQLWCVVTQSTARIPVHDSRSASFRLLETLVAGNVG